MKYLFFYLITAGLILCILLSGCNAKRDKRGDWMENLSGRTYEPIDWGRRRSPWYRNYRTTEELKSDWEKTYKKAIADLDKIIEDNTP